MEKGSLQYKLRHGIPIHRTYIEHSSSLWISLAVDLGSSYQMNRTSEIINETEEIKIKGPGQNHKI